jgi:hypothetical protein
MFTDGPLGSSFLNDIMKGEHMTTRHRSFFHISAAVFQIVALFRPQPMRIGCKGKWRKERKG